MNDYREMLEIIRRHRSIFSSIFVIAAVGMVISLFGTGSGGGSGGSILNPGVVGRVLDEKISYMEFTRTLSYRYEQSQAYLKQQLGDKANDPNMRQLYEKILMAQLNPAYLLEQSLKERFGQAQARKLGFKVPDSAVRYSLEKEKFFQKDGRFDPLTYKEKVARPGEFEDSIRKKLLEDSMRYGLSLPFSILSQEEIKELSAAKQARVFEILTVDLERMNYKPNLPESAKKEAAANPQVNTELMAYFQKHKAQYERDAQVHAKHILITEKEGGQKKLESIREEIAAKKITFEEAAKKYSIDKSNAPKGGDLGFFDSKQMDPSFSTAAFALKNPGDVSAVVKSAFGYHLIQLVARNEAVNKTFEQVKDEILENYLKDKLKRDYATQLLQGALNSKKALSSAEEKNLGTSWKALGPWTAMDERLGNISVTQLDVKELLATKAKGDMYPRVIPEAETISLLRLSEIKEAQVKPDELRAEKATQALDYYLDSSYQELEKKKKIYRAEKVLSQLQAQLQNGLPQE